MKKKIIIILSIVLPIVLAILIAGGILLAGPLGFDLLPRDRSGWHTTRNGSLQYLDANGDPLTGWQTPEQQLLYFLDDGSLAIGWQMIGSDRYYFDENGIVQTGYFELDGTKFYADETGKQLTGWQTVDGVEYYFTNVGIHTGWLETEEGIYYLQDDGTTTSGWLESEEGMYYLQENGMVTTGWADIAPHRYYFSEDGLMYTGWLETEEGTYYLKENGVMAIGQITLDRTNHYFTSTGKYILLVNNWNPLPFDFQTELVEIGGFMLETECAAALQTMMEAGGAVASEDYINSAYRSKEYQQKLWDERIQEHMDTGKTYDEALEQTKLYVATPGCSEHHTGLAVDLNTAMATFMIWVTENCWDYGFIVRYPDGKTNYTGINYEPWHFRYVGTELALELKGTGLCLEEYMERLTAQEAAKVARPEETPETESNQ